MPHVRGRERAGKTCLELVLLRYDGAESWGGFLERESLVKVVMGFEVVFFFGI